jgi:uncharacterized protein
MSADKLALAWIAGFLAGGINAVSGGGTLVCFPALLATGMSALAANITTSVGLLSGYAGGSIAYRPELDGQGARIRSLGPLSAAGAVVGAILLLSTPASSFRTVVPYLILVSCALLAVQPRLARRVTAWQSGMPPTTTGITPPVQFGVLLSAVYGSYFGAGLGVLLLAVLGLFLADGLQRLNALKGVLSLAINVVGVMIFVVSGHVMWSYAAVIASAAWPGGAVGVRVARLMPPQVLRISVVTLGVSVAVLLATR